MSRTEPRIRSFRLAVVLGLVLAGVGLYCLYDAYERRGIRAPWPLRALFPW